jgi:hypothetical protein
MGNRFWGEQMIEDQERYADPVDAGFARGRVEVTITAISAEVVQGGLL